MKKTLIALAVLAASGASMAQVTLYGVADVALGQSNQAQQAKSTGVVNSNFALTTQNVTLATNGNSNLNDGNSRWGLKGTEDLGGGLKASFKFESSIDLIDGANRGSGSTLFGRSAYLQLSGGFGSITAGRQYTPSFNALATWELTGAANYSVAVNQFSPALNAFRDNAMITYSTPDTLGGFNVTAGVVLGANQQFGTTNGTNNGAYDIAVSYVGGPVAAALAYNKVENGNQGTTLGVSYNFGPLTLAGSYNQDKDGSGNTVVQGYTLGVGVPVGNWNFVADVAQVTSGSALLPNNSSSTDVLFRAQYNLSKQTFVYGVLLSDGKGIATNDTSAWSVGVRHNF